MKTIKRIVFAMLLVCLCFSAAACDSNLTDGENNRSSSVAQSGENSSNSQSNNTEGSNNQSSSGQDSQQPDGGVDNLDSYIEHTALSEAITVKFKDAKASDASVYYKLNGTDSFIKVDSELVRQTSETEARADIIGLKAGIYSINVKPGDNSAQFTKNDIEVLPYDRSGYAHFGFTQGVGAYNDDGTLKSNAQVVYVSDETKNTVQHGGYTGLVNILANSSKFSYPLCVRFIGTIKTRSWDKKDASYLSTGTPCTSTDAWAQNKKDIDAAEGITDLNNLVDKITVDVANYVYNNRDDADGAIYKDGTTTTTYDSYFNMLEITAGKNVTVEGIGEDAGLFQWGMIWKKCNSIEVRNLTFTDNPEDACSVLGDTANPSLYGNFWFHNCVFNRGKNEWDITGPDQRDKADGDGATDITGCRNVTVAYCKYNNCKKTGLLGGSDTNLQYNITFHHNYFYKCASRLPLGRQANMHYYNNYNHQNSACMSLRANAFAFSEANYFDGCAKTVEVSSGGKCKSFGDYFSSTSGAATKVTNRTDSVSNNCTFGTNFDIDATKFYYDATTKKTKVSYMTTAQQAKTDCPIYAGVAKANPKANQQ